MLKSCKRRLQYIATKLQGWENGIANVVVQYQISLLLNKVIPKVNQISVAYK
jgi:hypothetical protein